MAYKAVVFDLDGTLVHTSPEYRYKVVFQVLNNLGALPSAFSNHNIDRFWFEAARDEIIKTLFGLEPELFWKEFQKYDTTELRKQFTRLYDDIDFIKELRKSGYKIGIVTGAPMHIASLEIGMLGHDNFDAVVVAHSSNGFKPKPNPHGLYECLKLLGISKSEAVYVGNVDEDIETAKNAEVFDVLLLRGENEHRNAKPSMVINSLYELRQLLEANANNSDS